MIKATLIFALLVFSAKCLNTDAVPPAMRSICVQCAQGSKTPESKYNPFCNTVQQNFAEVLAAGGLKGPVFEAAKSAGKVMVIKKVCAKAVQDAAGIIVAQGVNPEVIKCFEPKTFATCIEITSSALGGVRRLALLKDDLKKLSYN